MTRFPTLRWVLGRWDALTLAAAMRAALALAVGLPAMTALLSTGIADHPDGDHLLFDSGGMMLVEGVRLSLTAAPPVTKLTLLLAAGCVLLSLYPVSVMLVALEDRDGRLGEALGRGLRRLPALFAIYGLCLLFQVMVFVAAAFAAAWAPQQLAQTLGPALADAVGVLLLLFGVAINCASGVARDLAFAAASRRPAALPALLLGIGTLLARPLSVGVDWARLAAWQWVLVLGAAYCAGRFPAAPGWTLPLAAVTVSVLVGITTLRGVWAARCLVHASAAQPAAALQPAATMA